MDPNTGFMNQLEEFYEQVKSGEMKAKVDEFELEELRATRSHPSPCKVIE